MREGGGRNYEILRFMYMYVHGIYNIINSSYLARMSARTGD